MRSKGWSWTLFSFCPTPKTMQSHSLDTCWHKHSFHDFILISSPFSTSSWHSWADPPVLYQGDCSVSALRRDSGFSAPPPEHCWHVAFSFVAFLKIQSLQSIEHYWPVGFPCDSSSIIFKLDNPHPGFSAPTPDQNLQCYYFWSRRVPVGANFIFPSLLAE